MRRILAGTVAALSGAGLAQAEDITVFAAASLKTALDEIGADWSAATGSTMVASYAASSALAKQIQNGAPAQVFLSASTEWMDAIEQDGLLAEGTRHDLLGNTLVLVAHGSSVGPVAIGPDMDLSGLLAGGNLAMAMVDSVPAGQYGKKALESLGLWKSLEASVAQSENVRAALALVAAGEAPYGIVYGSDAIADDESGDAVSVVGTFPPDSHAPIVYPVAALGQAPSETTLSFLEYLAGPEAGAVFEDQGFPVLAR